MLNEDELRDALLLVFANKQDLPVCSKVFGHLLDIVANVNIECHERCRDHRQAWSTLVETARLGRSPSLYGSRYVC